MLSCRLLCFEIFFQEYHQSVGPDPSYLQRLFTDKAAQSDERRRSHMSEWPFAQVAAQLCFRYFIF